MYANKVWATLIFSGVIQCADFSQPTIKHVVLISPDFITIPKDTRLMASNWKDVPSLIWHVGVPKLIKMNSNSTTIYARGEEIAKEIPGAANTVRKLFGEELKEEYKLGEKALRALIASAVQPTKKPGAFDLLRDLKKAGHSIICVTAHDAEEHELFRDYLRDSQRECFIESIDGVITLPKYGSNVSEGQSYFFHENHTNKNQWLIANRKAESNYLEALDLLLQATHSTAAPLIILKSQNPADQVLKIFDGKQKFKIEQDDIGAVKQHLQHEGVLPRLNV